MLHAGIKKGRSNVTRETIYIDGTLTCHRVRVLVSTAALSYIHFYLSVGLETPMVSPPYRGGGV
jgi:hypothetical protein